ncbi:unnamed protein product [Fraxinus pennsylvanica]|uniref:AP2/ERF domain-containing protein n=1 Tax=Fraxinus pennsylvanica TaxID=56036 RepID=A0AAD1ZMH7_9LAMI|nr:unnamed protein product [Fraxinus pennsylvanica]
MDGRGKTLGFGSAKKSESRSSKVGLAPVSFYMGFLDILMLSDYVAGGKVSAMEEAFNRNLLGSFLLTKRRKLYMGYSVAMKLFFALLARILEEEAYEKVQEEVLKDETRIQVEDGNRCEAENSDKWVCEVREPNKKSRIWLGTFATAEMAARAHEVAAIALRGRSACLNFFDSAWKLLVPASIDAKGIQKAAAEAAMAFGQPNSGSSEAVSQDDIMEEAAAIWPRNAFFTDEEALFGMPGLIDNMAKGLMLPPPCCNDTDDQVYADVSLCSYSI